jgi:hypothetical protein
MPDDLTSFDACECPRCGIATKPRKTNKDGSVRYRHSCGDGVRYSWSIDRDGDICREIQTSN